MQEAMIESSLASNGYNQSVQSTGNDRDVEYQAFVHVTQAMSTVNEDAPDYLSRLHEALHKNLKLWTILAADVADANNKLPAELRSNLFYLAEFTRHHTAKIQSGIVKDVSALIDINKSVMRGLRAQAGLQETALKEGAAS